jgi:UDP-GlcNAc:undecaprenyl-phosphate GlcNAc-1-phosphate transferase
MIFSILVIFIFLINLYLFSSIERFAKLINIFDSPDRIRKFHSRKVPILGGIFIWLNILIFFILFNFTFFLEFKHDIKVSFLSILFFLFALGLYDDKTNLNPLKKLIFLTIIIGFFLQIEKKFILNDLFFLYKNYSIIISNKYLAYCITILCVLLLINASNMFDGVNFQCGFYFLIVFVILLSKNSSNFIIVMSTIFLVFYIFWNIKSKIFLGDGGINVFSFIIAYFFINNHNSQQIMYADEIFLILATPGIDMFRVFIARISKKKNPFFPDRIHIHHLLLNHFSKKFSQFLIFFNVLIPILLFYLFDYNIEICIILNLFIYFFLIIITYKKKNSINSK